MGWKIVEYYLRSVIEDGIAELRENVDEIDFVFRDLVAHPTMRKYGAKIVDDIKRWFAHTDIPVLAAYGQNDIKLPSITVHLAASQEAPEYRTMQDHWDYFRYPTAAALVAGPFFGTAYDAETGVVTFDKSLDLSQAIQGRKLYSQRIDQVFTLQGTMNTNEVGLPPFEQKVQTLTIVDAEGNIPEHIDIAELFLLSAVDFKMYRGQAAWFRETFEIKANANSNSDQAIWLYYILAYILMRYKHRFEEVGLESQTFGASEFFRDIGKAPNNIWGRTIRFTFLVNHEWREPVQVLELVGVNLNAENPVTHEIIGLT